MFMWHEIRNEIESSRILHSGSLAINIEIMISFYIIFLRV